MGLRVYALLISPSENETKVVIVKRGHQESHMHTYTHTRTTHHQESHMHTHTHARAQHILLRDMTHSTRSGQQTQDG